MGTKCRRRLRLSLDVVSQSSSLLIENRLSVRENVKF